MLADESRQELLLKLITGIMDNDKEKFIEAGKELYPHWTIKELEDDFARARNLSDAT